MQEMLRRMRQEREDGERGFTLIELLVVVVIIGVLIAIAIPLYLNYRKGAENKSAESDLRGAISTLEQCYSDSGTVYPSVVVATTGVLTGCATPSAVIKLSSGTTITYFPGISTGGTTADTAYSVWTQHTGNSNVFYCYASNAGGSIKQETRLGTAFASTCP